MDYAIFAELWNSLDEWSRRSKKLFELGIDSTRHDRVLYDMVMKLMSLYFNADQVNFIVWSIFTDDNKIEVEDGTVTIDSPELCWEYINKLKEEIKHELPS